MKKAIIITMALLTLPVAAAAFPVNPDTDKSYCAQLYRTGWGNMDFPQQAYYVLTCKQIGWP